LIDGKIEDLAAEGNVLRFRRTGASQRLEVLLNLNHEPAAAAVQQGTIVLSTCLDKEGEPVGGTIHLRPAEAVVLRLH
jgi:alpha-glucosidase